MFNFYHNEKASNFQILITNIILTPYNFKGILVFNINSF